MAGTSELAVCFFKCAIKRIFEERAGRERKPAANFVMILARN